MSNQQTISDRAYQLWCARGCPEGTAELDWAEAEQQIVGENAVPAARGVTASVDDSLRDTYPASDPPASHIPDDPPVNVDEKWKAAGLAPKR